jgi:hypothetical protein
MTEQEHADYDNHPHRVDLYGNHAGQCCMDALDAIERRRKHPTLFEVEL